MRATLVSVKQRSFAVLSCTRGEVTEDLGTFDLFAAESSWSAG